MKMFFLYTGFYGKMRVLKLVFVYYNCFNIFSMAVIQYKKIVRYTGNDNLYFNTDHIVDLLNVVNARRCATFCGQRAECMSFFYNNALEICRLHSADYFQISDGITVPNWKFYVTEDTECPGYLGFFYDEAGEMCVHVATNTYKFSEGQQYCSQRNARVISLETTKKRLAFSNLIQRPDVATLIPKQVILLGIHKTNGVWKWQSGATLSDSNWGIGQPFCPSGTVCECAGLLIEWAGHTWNDDVCGGQRSLVCEYVGN
ncbi:uncharacterized protein LOC123532197 [Mercenaria mercenaria]|uniref:uncharacterized protein LOC123532197 n=1 Tax=Mercenaria mercenaria TaxID=6596 RepID=UPI00234EF12C|nr:uncharacterized protein LOC123532197 [Mercenaria mercenaria]